MWMEPPSNISNTRPIKPHRFRMVIGVVGSEHCSKTFAIESVAVSVVIVAVMSEMKTLAFESVMVAVESKGVAVVS